jgi:Ca2+-binding RTX toxin-like protein
MSNIVLIFFGGFGFNTDNFWAGRSTTPIQQAPTTYDFLNVAGYFIRVTGTGLTYDNDDPLAGVYTDIGVYTDNSYTTLVDSFSSPTDLHFSAFFTDFAIEALVGADTITGSTGDDRITGYGGADTMDGGDGSDTYVFSTDDVVTGEQITDTGGGVGDIDTVLIGSGGNVNFSDVTILGVEALTFEGSGTATFNASQPP